MATDILGKVGQKVGQEIKIINDNIANNLATKAELGTLSDEVGALDFTPYATNTALGVTNGNVTTNGTAISTLQTGSATKAELALVLNGTTKATKIVSSEGEFDSLKVKGSTTIVNTTTVEISDNIIELNLANDDSETAQTSGLNINRGKDGAGVVLDKASFLWQDTNSLWEAKKGSAYADLKAKDITATNFSGIFKATSGTNITVNNVELGDVSSFTSALAIAKTAI